MGVFQGHQIPSLIGTVAMATFFLIPLIFKWLNIMPKIGRGMKLWDYFWVYVYALLIPNSTYAFFEVRHLILNDNVADTLTLLSYVVFGGISLIGLLTTIWGIRLVVDYYSKSNMERLVYTSFLSIICSFGAVAGVLQFNSVPYILFPPALIVVVLHTMGHPFYVGVAIITTIFLLTLNLFMDLFLKPT
ncbi:TPA: hypothetical protein DIU27_00065 [Candidatus Collierbacteria bacterium]|nr:MAG: hypothetical protein UW42_C0011G0003 [Candidatus Collierbacteria bacterium GW2011_GWB1_44_197]HCQ30764.1 hypothetical protein [Candidatus Collierbacteria bacterium]